MRTPHLLLGSLVVFLIGAVSCATTFATAPLSTPARWSERLLASARVESILRRWDISSKYETPEGFEHPQYIARIEGYLRQQCAVDLSTRDMTDIAVQMGVSPDRLFGATGFFERTTVVISNRLTVAGHLKVLSHEAGHVFQPRPILAYDEAEVFAELVSYRLLTLMDAGHEQNTIRYLSDYPAGMNAVEARWLSEVERIAQGLGRVVRSPSSLSSRTCLVRSTGTGTPRGEESIPWPFRPYALFR